MAQNRSIDIVGSMHGPPLDEIAWPIDADPGYLEAVGIACEGVEAGPGLYAAGDAIADRPRTLLQAVYSGALAGAAAAAGAPGDRGRRAG
jgi:glycerol-3-phosphate dehydrogenase subunit B